MPESMPPSTAFQIYDSITDVTTGLMCVLDKKTRQCATDYNYESMENPELLRKLVAISTDLADHTLLYTLLKNVPNMTFDKLFEELGPRMEDSIVHCDNSDTTCLNMKKVDTGHFPKCFTYATQNNMSLIMHQKFSEEGISNGLMMVINIGAQLASEAIRKKSQDNNKVSLFSDFMNTYQSFSANGLRLMVHIPTGNNIVSSHVSLCK